jgi:DNA-binding response OmpR family regulator
MLTAGDAMRILVVDDNESINKLVRASLEGEGYSVDSALTGEEAEQLAENVPYDLIILDIILPGKNGLEVCKSLRQNKVRTPILMLTGKTEEWDQVHGLDIGADDYLGKPFQISVLRARVRALLRREPQNIVPRIELGKCVLDTTTRQIWIGKREVLLTAKEYSILEYLFHHPNLIVTRLELEQHTWNVTLEGSSNIVDQHIKNLRKKLEGGITIETIRGSGYRLKA